MHLLSQFSKRSIRLCLFSFRIYIGLPNPLSGRCFAFSIFLWMASFHFLESRAILTDLSFLTVITTGLMNSSSEHFSNFMICLSSISFWSSFSTFSRKCRGNRLPLCWDGVYSVLKIDFAMWFFERPNFVHKCGYF